MLRKRDGFVSLGDVAEAVALPGDRALTHRDGGPRRCCMNTLWGWGGLARTSPDAVLPVAPAAGGGPLNGRLAGSYRPNIP